MLRVRPPVEQEHRGHEVSVLRRDVERGVAGVGFDAVHLCARIQQHLQYADRPQRRCLEQGQHSALRRTLVDVGPEAEEGHDSSRVALRTRPYQERLPFGGAGAILLKDHLVDLESEFGEVVQRCHTVACLNCPHRNALHADTSGAQLVDPFYATPRHYLVNHGLEGLGIGRQLEVGR